MTQQGFRDAEPCGLTKESVYALAESVAKEVEYAPNGSLKAVLKKMGGQTELRDFWELDRSDSGSIEIRKKGDFTIFLSKQTTAERDRFTIAHELGHYVLHYLWHISEGKTLGPVRAPRYPTSGDDRAEWEANWFAAAFLMPAAAFKRSAHRHRTNGRIDFAALAAEFGVSTAAASVRAKALGI